VYVFASCGCLVGAQVCQVEEGEPSLSGKFQTAVDYRPPGGLRLLYEHAKSHRVGALKASRRLSLPASSASLP
jgi:hypothetical protein